MTDQDIAAANRLHDAIHGDPFELNKLRLKSGWNTPRMAVGALLTDKKIGKYEKDGYFTEAFRELRRQYQAKKRGHRRRDGNFDIIEGRLVYRP